MWSWKTEKDHDLWASRLPLHITENFTLCRGFLAQRAHGEASGIAVMWAAPGELKIGWTEPRAKPGAMGIESLLRNGNRTRVPGEAGPRRAGPVGFLWILSSVERQA